MTVSRNAKETVKFVDEYCELYRDLFGDVRSFEYFKLLHIGLMSDMARKSLPAVAKAVGESDSQDLHHFVAEGRWSVEALRERRLALTQQALRERGFTLCIDETGDRKKGNTTDYTARQYIGNVGKIENGIVSVNAYGVLEDITFPLLFRVFKPQKRLKVEDSYRTKPQLAIELIQTLKQQGFTIELVLADCLYGESGTFVEELFKQHLPFVVAIRDNHGVWMGPGEHIRSTRWRSFERVFSDETHQTRYIREIIFGQRGTLRYYQLTSDPTTLPAATTCLVMTNLPGNLRHRLGNLYGLRTWIEYGFKQAKNELGWADYRLTDYAAIERWWELVFSTYLLISLHTPLFQTPLAPLPILDASQVAQHPRWCATAGWKRTLNNLRLLLQPFIALGLLLPWLIVFPIPALARNLHQLVTSINSST